MEMLESNNIELEIEDHPMIITSTLGQSNNTIEYTLKLKRDSFQIVDNLQNKFLTDQVAHVDKDYYLFSFTDSELIEIVEKSDEWGKFDLILAKKILREKGIVISESRVIELREERIEKLSKPEKSQMIWVILGYISAIGGGLFGILIGTHLKNHQRTLPNGERVYEYTVNDRNHGKIIFNIGIISLILSIGIWLMAKLILKD
jgi:hypothetical protein